MLWGKPRPDLQLPRATVGRTHFPDVLPVPMATRVGAYGVCVENDQVLLTRWTPRREVPAQWTLPGGQVEYGEDPVDAVTREFAEETGHHITVVRLLGVDSRTITSAQRLDHGPDLHNVGIYYQVRITGGELRSEPDGMTAEPTWVPVIEVSELVRATLVDIGLALLRERPETGHVAAVPVEGLRRH